MITEKEIDLLLEKIESNPDFFQKRIAYFSNKYPGFFHHISKESFILSDAEKDYLVGILCFIFEIINIDFLEDGSEYAENEDQNWALLDSNKSLSKVFDIWFQNFSEEDLLAYIEDALAEDEEDFLSKVGREFIAIKSKTLLDMYIATKD